MPSSTKHYENRDLTAKDKAVTDEFSTSGNTKINWHSQITDIAQTFDGLIGIYAVDHKTASVFSQNSNDYFPMASIDKIPIAAYCLSLISNGDLQLEQMIDIKPTDLRIGTGILNKRFTIPGVTISLENMIKLLLETSDNTANDIILRLIGGPKAVTNWLHEVEINNIDISRSCLRGLADQIGLEKIPDNEQCTLEQFQQWENALDPESKKKAEEDYLLDYRDTATPKAIVDLLYSIQSNKLFPQKYSSMMLQFMQRCQTGPARIRGLLPPNIKVAHKTGSMFGITNDAGIMYTSNNSDSITLAIFVKSTATSLIEKERVIAQIAKIVFENLL